MSFFHVCHRDPIFGLRLKSPHQFVSLQHASIALAQCDHVTGSRPGYSKTKTGQSQGPFFTHATETQCLVCVWRVRISNIFLRRRGRDERRWPTSTATQKNATRQRSSRIRPATKHRKKWLRRTRVHYTIITINIECRHTKEDWWS